MTGKIIRITQTKGYGFIKNDLDGKDYFFHKDDFNGHWVDLVEDYFAKEKVIYVEFKSDKTEKGLRARKVKRTDGVN